jgi:SpoVK/Ycf46/Vps4 family AAA+-type ATPase
MDVADSVKQICVMPDARFAKLWDSIIVAPEIKDRLLRSAILALRLRGVLPFETTALHGLVLLYGPPGTGKTTLARGLAYHLAPFAKRRKARLIEINPNGLMSPEHGQSQRKVTELLSEYVPGLADNDMPTVVLIDEVESLAVARSEASLAANPADVHRATDAVLTAIDGNAVTHPNLLFVVTSNFTNTLDEAFLSRVDVAIHVPPPDVQGILAILRTTLMSMSKAFGPLEDLASDSRLIEVAVALAGADGRRIRKTISEAMLTRLETVVEPGNLTIEDLLLATSRIMRCREAGETHGGGTCEPS